MNRVTTWSMVVGAGPAAGCEASVGVCAGVAVDGATGGDGCAVCVASAATGCADGCESAACCAAALIGTSRAASRAAANIALHVRMSRSPIFLRPSFFEPGFSDSSFYSLHIAKSTSPKLSVRQLERHMHNGGGINRLAAVHGRLEPDLVGGCHGRFIQSVAQASHHAVHVQRTVRRKTDFEKHFALQLHTAGFIGINRVRLECNFDRRAGPCGIGLRDLWSSTVHYLLRSKSPGRNPAAFAAAFACGRDAAAEIRAGNRALNSFGSA